ncbi:NAD(P)/FAD-dependent oxidoreductase [Desulfovibrio sp.]|uniref:NAD(P)/FAD-dependent oxidoreductase n=1 Tax=Desulfovibrio sp. TaxID=885 RepID=UPI003D0DC1FB
MSDVKIFPAETGVSGWFETSSYKKHQFNSPEEILDSYDFVIVGCGYGGFGAAWRFAELNPGAKIAIFEAIRVGTNDSGKNAGFLIDVPHAFGGDESTLEDKKWCVRLNVASQNKMRKIIKDHGLKVDWDDCGKYLAANERSAFKFLDHEAKDLDDVGVPYQYVEHEELSRRLGTRYYKKALFNPGSALVNPADVLRGMCTVLPPNVHLFEETPVLRVEDEREPKVVLVNGRKIRCKAVVVPVSSFLEQFGLSKNEFCPIISFGALSRQLDEAELEALGKDVKPWGVTAAHSAGTTVRFTHDNRLLVRNGLMYATWLTSSPERIRRSRRMLRKAFNNRFPNHKHVNFEYVWGGMIHLTMNAKPVFGRKGNIFYSGVGEGAGIIKAFTMGTYHAEWANNMQSDVLEYLKNDKKPNRLPPEPFRTVGAECRLLWETATARGEI